MDRLEAFGHKNVLCSHPTTIEITKDTHLSKRGNCILGIKASKACFDLNDVLRNQIRKGKRIQVTIYFNGKKEDSFYGYGHENLKLLDKNDMVFRKSNYTCDRTILVDCNKSSSDLNKDLIKKLQEKDSLFHLIFEI